MKLGYIGLGKMGFNMVLRLLEKGYEVVAFSRTQDTVKRISGYGAEPANSLKYLASATFAAMKVFILITGDGMVSPSISVQEKGCQAERQRSPYISKRFRI